jgi:hypothetical protein
MSPARCACCHLRRRLRSHATRRLIPPADRTGRRPLPAATSRPALAALTATESRSERSPLPSPLSDDTATFSGPCFHSPCVLSSLLLPSSTRPQPTVASCLSSPLSAASHPSAPPSSRPAASHLRPHPRILTTARANGTEVTASLSKDLLVAANGCADHADP